MEQLQSSLTKVSVTCSVRRDDVELLKEIARNLTDPAYRMELVDTLNSQGRAAPKDLDMWRALAPF